MTPEGQRRDAATRWLGLAGRDLHAALLLVLEEPSVSVFHSPQVAEKSVKAMLALRNLPFRKTHDLKELGKQCADVESSLTPFLADAADLTDYPTVFRYLDAPREPDAAEAEAALATARRLYDEISALVAKDQSPELETH